MLEVGRRLIHELTNVKMVGGVEKAHRKYGGVHAMPG